MKRVLVITNNLKQASFRLCVQALVEPLKQRGFDLDVQVRPRGWLARRRLLSTAGDYDSVLLHRKLLDPLDARLLRRRARRIIYGLDDAVMYEQKQRGRFAQWRTTRRFHATAAIADHVVAGNEYLAEHFSARGCGVTVLPTVVDPADYQVKTHHDTGALRLVWIGSRSTLPYVRQYLPAIDAAARKLNRLRLTIIADKNLFDATIPIEHIPWSRETEAASLLKGDIGIAPTPSNRWTLGKCGFKIIQYMACGLPVIASPVGANAQIVTPETGILASSNEQWIDAIARLMNDVALRSAMGRAGRARIESDYTINGAVNVWAELLDK